MGSSTNRDGDATRKAGQPVAADAQGASAETHTGVTATGRRPDDPKAVDRAPRTDAANAATAKARMDDDGANRSTPVAGDAAHAHDQLEKHEDRAANRDPITKAPGSHPVGTGVGAMGGGLAGAAVGALGGPIGIAVGAVAGAVAGGLAGKSVAEVIDPTVEDAYWEKTYLTRPYAGAGAKYSNFRPAFQYGWDGAARYAGKQFADVEADMARDWKSRRAGSTLEWSAAKPAVRDAWDRVANR